MKNKKLLVSIFTSVLLIGVIGFFVFKNLNKEKEEGGVSVEINGGLNGAIVKELSSETTQLGNVLSQAPSLDKPIVIKNVFTPDVEKIFQKNIQDQLDYLKDNKTDSNGWITLGTLRKAVGDYDGAREAWNFAVLLNPESSVAFFNLGELYGFYLKDLPNAEKNYLLAIQKDSQNSQAYTDLADLYWADRKGEKQERIESLLKKGIDTVAGQAKNMIIFRLAKYYEDIKELGNAAIYYDMFLKNDPANADIQQKLIELQR